MASTIQMHSGLLFSSSPAAMPMERLARRASLAASSTSRTTPTTLISICPPPRPPCLHPLHHPAIRLHRHRPSYLLSIPSASPPQRQHPRPSPPPRRPHPPPQQRKINLNTQRPVIPSSAQASKRPSASPPSSASSSCYSSHGWSSAGNSD